MDAEATIRDRYADLRTGDPLPPYFAAGSAVVKVGVSERPIGRDRHAWFSDEV